MESDFTPSGRCHSCRDHVGRPSDQSVEHEKHHNMLDKEVIPTDDTKAALLRELNKRRTRERKEPLASYPEIGRTSCGERDGREKLIQSPVFI